MASYTEGEFRQIADAFEPSGVVARIHNGIGEREIFARDIVAMLRQAADMMERDEKREKKYEYALVANGVMYDNHYFDFRSATLTRGFGEKVVRREVGDWEEVSNG